MRVPDAVWDADESQARGRMQAFVDDLEGNALDAWRRGVPTYARIDVDGDAVAGADVYFADGDGHEALTTAGLMRRLEGGGPRG
jgi:hypothetical protein